MKLLNIICSSMIVIATWMIARQLLDYKQSIICTIIAVLLPFHYVFPRFIMSENLFYPLFLFAIFAVLYTTKT